MTSDFEPTRYEAVKAHHEKDFVLENYTALQFEKKAENQPYTSLSFKDEPERNGTSTGPTYAVISPENDAQYTPVCGPNNTGVFPRDNSMFAPNQDQHSGQSSSLWPVYQELEVENVYQNRINMDKGVDLAGGRRRDDIVDHTYAETVTEPLYHIVNENATEIQSDEHLNQKEIVDRAGDYVIPCKSTKLPKDCVQEPAYSQTHYVQPNPIDKGSLTMGPRNQQSKCIDDRSRRPNSAENVKRIQRFEPITSEDETYLTIMK